MKTIPKIEDVIGDYPEFTGVHPKANAFPMKSDEDFWRLVEHIRENGVANELLREKGTGLLIDGRSRLLAVSITQSLFEVADVEPVHVLAYVTANNLHAMQLSTEQKKETIVRLNKTRSNSHAIEARAAIEFAELDKLKTALWRAERDVDNAELGIALNEYSDYFGFSTLREMLEAKLPHHYPETER